MVNGQSCCELSGAKCVLLRKMIPSTTGSSGFSVTLAGGQQVHAAEVSQQSPVAVCTPNSVRETMADEPEDKKAAVLDEGDIKLLKTYVSVLCVGMRASSCSPCPRNRP